MARKKELIKIVTQAERDLYRMEEELFHAREVIADQDERIRDQEATIVDLRNRIEQGEQATRRLLEDLSGGKISIHPEVERERDEAIAAVGVLMSIIKKMEGGENNEE